MCVYSLWRQYYVFTLWASVLATLQSGSTDRQIRYSLRASSVLPNDTRAWAFRTWAWSQRQKDFIFLLRADKHFRCSSSRCLTLDQRGMSLQAISASIRALSCCFRLDWIWDRLLNRMWSVGAEDNRLSLFHLQLVSKWGLFYLFGDHEQKIHSKKEVGLCQI